MRKIKFRGRSLTNGKWVIGDSIKHTENADGAGIGVLSYIGARVPNARKVGAMKWTPVDPDTIGQFTGFLDRTGKEIYEGDIVEFCSCVGSFGAIWETARIEYRATEGGYVGIYPYHQTRDGREIVRTLTRCLNECIVVGNIHDDLMKGGEK